MLNKNVKILGFYLLIYYLYISNQNKTDMDELEYQIAFAYNNVFDWEVFRNSFTRSENDRPLLCEVQLCLN